MKKYLVVLTMIFIANLVHGQKYFTKTGFTEFKASVETFEPVEAKNNSTTAILNVESGEVAALMFIKAFRFNVALMEEHFNENYMDSDKYPKATFKGSIKDFDLASLSSTPKEYKVTGVLTIRGKDKPVESTVSLKLIEEKIMVSGGFSVKPEDFDIEIPSVVSKKIAENVNINLEYELVKK